MSLTRPVTPAPVPRPMHGPTNAAVLRPKPGCFNRGETDVAPTSKTRLHQPNPDRRGCPTSNRSNQGTADIAPPTARGHTLRKSSIPHHHRIQSAPLRREIRDYRSVRLAGKRRSGDGFRNTAGRRTARFRSHQAWVDSHRYAGIRSTGWRYQDQNVSDRAFGFSLGFVRRAVRFPQAAGRRAG